MMNLTSTENTSDAQELRMKRGTVHNDVRSLVEETLKIVGGDVVLGLPIGLGKPLFIANEFYRRAKAGEINLTISSGLFMEAPGWNSDLERRFIEPLTMRLFPDWPKADFYADIRKGALPDNVHINDFYFTPGTGLGNGLLQQGYISANFTHVARDVTLEGCNVVAVTVTPGKFRGRDMYSMGGNADASVDMVWSMMAEREKGRNVAIVAEVNPEMPFMHGTGVLPPDLFNGLLDTPAVQHSLFAPPKEPISASEYFIGFGVSSLIRDGGTFQVGFGSLGDALTYALLMRQENNSLYRRLMDETGLSGKFHDEIDCMGGLGIFEKGLYVNSEFFSDGIMSLIKSGIVKRKVYDNIAIQRLIVEGRIDSQKVERRTLEALLEAEAIHPQLTKRDFDMLREFGIFKQQLEFKDGSIFAAGDNGHALPADLTVAGTWDILEQLCMGDQLKGGILVHTGFMLGSKEFYQHLRTMGNEERETIQMREISFVNQLYGGEELRRLQRLSGRFVNSAMMATMMGAVISDTLDDGQVVSGVGGQYNFVSMGHALEDGRSIIILRSTRMKDGAPLSNLVWSSGNATIPRHLRDVVVTEYGIADLRGKTDSQCIKAMLNITDSGFQDELMKKAKSVKKLAADYKIPDIFRNNTAGMLEDALRPYKKEGLFKMFPYGCDFTKEELVLGKALRGLKTKMSLQGFEMPPINKLGAILRPSKNSIPFLERMGLGQPATFKEKVMQKLVLYALATDGSI